MKIVEILDSRASITWQKSQYGDDFGYFTTADGEENYKIKIAKMVKQSTWAIEFVHLTSNGESTDMDGTGHAAEVFGVIVNDLYRQLETEPNPDTILLRAYGESRIGLYHRISKRVCKRANYTYTAKKIIPPPAPPGYPPKDSWADFTLTKIKDQAQDQAPEI